MFPDQEPTVAPFIIEAEPSDVPGGWPRGGATRLDIPNNHLQYAITWFDTYAGTSTAEQVWTPVGANLSLSIEDLTTDVAAKLDLVIRFARCDFDLDGDVDQDDFGRFQTCLSGGGVEQNHPDCAGAQLDTDTDVDGDDLETFQDCTSGANRPADPSCTD